MFTLSGGAASLVACGDDASDGAPARPTISLGDAGYVDATEPDASKPRVDGGFEGPDGGVIRADRFVTDVVSFTPGPCAGFGAAQMPDVVLGPPVGAGDLAGSLDVVSLGVDGEIVLSFGANAIVDGPGADFIVFENAFYAGGNPSQPAADPGEVSVSEDGVTWETYECTPGAAAPYGKCAGWHSVHSAPGNGISPVDPATAGGEAYDLAELGLTRARFVRIRDKSTAACEGTPKPNSAGFDLDAIAIVHAETP
ncbi:MAG: cell surface protein [Labilithrix sp.]|nr:cell surface protein [Labilithrix sp.]